MSRPLRVLLCLLTTACGGSVTGNAPDHGSSSGTPAADASTGKPPGSVVACMLVASSYDDSCSTDEDCSNASFGDYCSGTRCLCDEDAIAKSALAQFQADVSKTPLGSGAIRGVECSCVPPPSPCCRAGTCTTACWSPSDTLPACADAGGSCAPPGASCGGVSGPRFGPSGSCANADEVCCL